MLAKLPVTSGRIVSKNRVSRNGKGELRKAVLDENDLGGPP